MKGDASRRASTLAFAILLLLCLGRAAGIFFLYGRITVAAVVQVGFTAGLFAVPLLYPFPGPRRVLARYRWPVLGFQAALTWVPVAMLGARWQVGTGGLLAGLVLLSVPGWASWPAAGCLLTAEVAVPAGITGAPGLAAWPGMLWAVVACTDVAAVFFGVVRLAQLVGEAQQAQGRVAWLAVARERLRAAGELRSAVGERLAGIADAVSAARQALPGDPGAARAQVATAGAAAREAVARARALTVDAGRLPRAGAATGLVPGWRRWAGYAAVVASLSVLCAAMPLPGLTVRDGGPGVTLYEAASYAFAGLLVYGLSRLTGMAQELAVQRKQLARMAAVQERLRVARDVHDLLGLGLSAIALKADLVGRLIGHDDGQAAAELEELGTVCATARADVRLVTGDGRRLSLTGECTAARQILTSAGVRVHASMSTVPLPASADDVLAPVLREAVTNILRHSAATSCAIEVAAAGSTLRLAVRNDGVTGRPGRVPADGRPGNGSGLANAAARLRAAGGRLATCRADGWFELIAEIPGRVLGPAPPPRVRSQGLQGAGNA